jgi:FkbM family methyltransferase
MNLLRTIRDYRAVYRNYFKILYTLYKNKDKSMTNEKIEVKVILKNGEKMVVPYGFVTTYVRLHSIANPNISDLRLTKQGIYFTYKNHPVILNVGRFSDPDAVFFHEDYKFLEVKDIDVIDIGMNIGDSSIYFSLNGASKVFGIEPYPYAFLLANENVKLNNIDNIITLNAGYGIDSEIVLDETKISNNASSLVGSEKGLKIPILSLNTLFNKYDIREAVVKMDCEGCEYALLNEDEKVIRKIKQFQIEYHYGYERLINKLREWGFDVEYTEPKKVYNPDAENPNMELGYIYAKRRP